MKAGIGMPIQRRHKVMQLLILQVVLCTAQAWSFFGGEVPEPMPVLLDVQEVHSYPFAEKHMERALGVPAHLAVAYSAETFDCGDGISIAASAVNDNFCDCRTGADEPGTSACSGVVAMAADTATANQALVLGKLAVFHCINEGYRVISIPASRVDDGVCDCCDGSDEGRYVTCTKTCARAAARDFAEKKQFIDAFKAGSALRRRLESSVSEDLDAKKVGALGIDDEIAELTRRMEEVEERHCLAGVERQRQIQSQRESAYAQMYSCLGLATSEQGGLSDELVADLSNALHNVLGMTLGEVTRFQEKFIKESGTRVHEEEGEARDDAAEVAADEDMMPVSEEEVVEGREGSEEEREGVADTGTGASMVKASQMREYVLYLVEKKKPLSQIQCLLAYQHVHGVFGGEAEAFVLKHNEASKQTDTCAEAYVEISDPAALQRYCNIYDNIRPLIDALENVSKDALNGEKEKVEQAKVQLDMKVEVKNALEADQQKFQQYLEADAVAFLGLKECASLVHGKYEYRVCFDGQVTQKDLDSQGSTRLGNFDKVEQDTETAQTVLHFTGGDHCWNHGARVADVHVSCGEESRVLSCAEPSTCVYTIQMASPAACSRKWAEKLGLPVDWTD